MFMRKNIQFKFTGRSGGFTLVELLITITIIGILAAIIIPSYNDQVQRTRRGDAKTSLMRAAQELERCFSDTSAYDDALCPSFPRNSAENLYTIDATVLNATQFTLTAVPIAGTPQEDDNQCAQFSIDHTGRRQAQDSDEAAQPACWQ